MKTSLKRKVPEWLTWLVLGLGLAFSIFAAVEKNAELRDAFARRAARRQAAREAILKNPASIENWMTFDYVNRIFGLPPQYLQNALPVTNARYPRLTLRSAAKEAKMQETDYVAAVRRAVGLFLKH